MSLFSGFRMLMTTGAKMTTLRSHLTHELIMQLRLSQVFESLSEKSLFYTDFHEDAKDLALYFTFENGVDIQQKYSGWVEATLYINRENQLVLSLKNERKETFMGNISNFEMEFFHPKEKEWTREWKNDQLPPIIRLKINEKSYSFQPPKASRVISFS